MRSHTAAVLASLLAGASAAPAAPVDSACDVVTSSTSSCTVIVTTVLSTDVPSIIATIPSATVTTSAIAGVNVQAFTGALGGPPPPVISGTGSRPFSVAGDTFVGLGAALGRSCDKQHNACANAANSGQLAGGVGQCDAQNDQCRALIARKLRLRQAKALDLGSCSDPTILFRDGLDGRKQPAFVAANQRDFNHGSALNIGVIAGFVCQRLGSPCGAPAEVQAACASASAAAVAAKQDQSAADAFNAILGGVGIAAGATGPAAVQTSAAAAAGASCTAVENATPTVGAVAVTITSCV